MKTKLVICLALFTASSSLEAEPANRAMAPAKTRIQQGAQNLALRQAAPVKRVMPTPQARIPAARVGTASLKAPSLSRQLTRNAITPAKVADPAGSVRRSIPADSRVPGKLSGLRESRDIANGLRDADTIRNGSLEGLREHGIRGQGHRGPQGPADPFQEDGFSPRQPQAPAGIKQRGDNGGLADIRGGSERSRQGHVSHGDVFASGYRLHFGPGSGFSGSVGSPERRSSPTPSAEGNGDTVSVDYTNQDGSHGTYSVTETHDQNGRYVTIEHNGVEKRDGTIVSTDTRRDTAGRIISTTETLINPDGSQSSMTTYPDGTATVEDHPAAESGGDRTPDGIGTGGTPAPSAATASGLVPLDLLRQHADGEQNRGGAGQYSIQGKTGANQVRPGGEGQQTGIGGINRIPLKPDSSVINPGPIDSTPGNDDRP